MLNDETDDFEKLVKYSREELTAWESSLEKKLPKQKGPTSFDRSFALRADS